MSQNSSIITLEDYMENTDASVIEKNINKLISGATHLPANLKDVALGASYHDLCVAKMIYAKERSYARYINLAMDALTKARKNAPADATPIIETYINSTVSLRASVSNNPFLLIKVIRKYNQLVKQYAEACYLPLFLRASLLENLPNVFGAHRFARQNFEQIISLQRSNPQYCPAKIINFCKQSIDKLS